MTSTSHTSGAGGGALLVVGTGVALVAAWLLLQEPQAVGAIDVPGVQARAESARSEVRLVNPMDPLDEAMGTEPPQPAAVEDRGRVEASSVPTRRIKVTAPKLLKNIQQRQEAIRQHLAVLRVSREGEETEARFRAARSISSLSVMTIMDAEGLSDASHIDLTMEDWMTRSASGKNTSLPTPNPGALASGGAYYTIPGDDFSEYHRMQSMGKRSEVDPELLAQVIERAQVALSYGP